MPPEAGAGSNLIYYGTVRFITAVQYIELTCYNIDPRVFKFTYVQCENIVL